MITRIAKKIATLNFLFIPQNIFLAITITFFPNKIPLIVLVIFSLSEFVNPFKTVIIIQLHKIF